MTTVVFAYNDYDNILVFSPNSIIDDKYDDQNDIATINMLFIEGLKPYTKNIESSAVSCENDDCALTELSKSANSKVVYTQLQKLGSKIIFSGSILGNDGTSFQSRATAMNLEDMEKVCLRLSKSIALQETIEEAADIDNITEQDEEEPARRASLSRVGISAGYMFPLGNTFYHNTYEGGQRVKFGVSYYYGFQNNTALLGNLVIGSGLFAMELNTLKFTNNVDTSPFYGFGLGMASAFNPNPINNYDYDNNSYDNDEEFSDFGTSISLHGGVMLYRTYDVNVIAQAKYFHIFNTNGDKALMLDIIFQIKMKPKRRKTVINRYPLIEALLGS